MHIKNNTSSLASSWIPIRSQLNWQPKLVNSQVDHIFLRVGSPAIASSHTLILKLNSINDNEKRHRGQF